MILCDYGCGQEAKHQFKNGKWCCSKSQNSCFYLKKIKGEERRGILHSKEAKDKMSFSHKQENLSEKSLENMSKAQKERFEKEEEREKSRQRMKSLMKNTDLREVIKNRTKKAMKKYYKENPEKYKELSEKAKKQCLNGHAHYMLKHVKNPSKEEILLRKIVKELCPESEHSYKILDEKNYTADNVIVKFKIAIEYDGYFHFCDQERINYHNKREKEIKSEGWKFLRYNIYQPFPTKEQVWNDIKKLMEN